MESHRTKYSYRDIHNNVCIVTTNLKVGDEVQIKLSNVIVRIDEVFTLNADKHHMNKEGLHIRGIIINDGSMFPDSSRKGEKTYAIPSCNIRCIVKK